MPFNQIQFASLADWQGQAVHSGWRKIAGEPDRSVRTAGTARPGGFGSSRASAAIPPPYVPPAPPEKSNKSTRALLVIVSVLLAGAAV
jgi:hypothetical protein